MSFTIHIQNEEAYPINAGKLQAAARTVLSQHGVAEQAELTVRLTNNAAVHRLNLQFRQVDAPTDVLSFPADPLPPELREDEMLYLGDLVIAYPYARAQAQHNKHDVQDSLVLLLVHGILHLLGYEHDTPEKKGEMWAAQATALNALGIDAAIVPALESDDHA